MNEHRAKTLDMCMANAMPYQQHYEYRTTLALSEVINDKFFLPMRGQLYPGDSITLCRLNSTNGSRKDTILSEVATVRVISAGDDGVPLKLIGEIVKIEAPVAPAETEVRRGPGRPPKAQAA